MILVVGVGAPTAIAVPSPSAQLAALLAKSAKSAAKLGVASKVQASTNSEWNVGALPGGARWYVEQADGPGLGPYRIIGSKGQAFTDRVPKAPDGVSQKLYEQAAAKQGQRIWWPVAPAMDSPTRQASLVADLSAVLRAAGSLTSPKPGVFDLTLPAAQPPGTFSPLLSACSGQLTQFRVVTSKGLLRSGRASAPTGCTVAFNVSYGRPAMPAFPTASRIVNAPQVLRDTQAFSQSAEALDRQATVKGITRSLTELRKPFGIYYVMVILTMSALSAGNVAVSIDGVPTGGRVAGQLYDDPATWERFVMADGMDVVWGNIRHPSLRCTISLPPPSSFDEEEGLYAPYPASVSLVPTCS